jgi:large subunit ribosomal protein L22
MEAKATFRFLRMPDRKVRVVMELVKGKKVDLAFNILKFTEKRSAEIVYKLLRSAVSNITAKKGTNLDNLYVASAFADQGPSFKKLHARAMGRGGMIKRRFCHATVIVTDTTPKGTKIRKKKGEVIEKVSNTAAAKEEIGKTEKK